MLPKCNQNVVLYWLCVGIFSLSSSFSYPFRFRKTALCSLHIKTQKWKWIFGVSVRVNVPLEWQIFIWYNENQAIQANQISVEKRNYWKRNTIFICDHHTSPVDQLDYGKLATSSRIPSGIGIHLAHSAIIYRLLDLDMAANEIMTPTVNANCQYSTRYCCKLAWTWGALTNYNQTFIK